MISLTIDGKTIEVHEGTTVLRAAEMAGITIPTLCDHPELTPYGGCRLCIVEVQGFRVPVASCKLPASQGMVVLTDTEKLRNSRKFILSLLFSERNHFCPFCQVSGGDCELQNAAYVEGMTHWPLSPNWKTFPVDTSHTFFVLDNNRCILCRRCVRACAELSGNFTLSIAERGARSMVVADSDVPLGDSTCISCGSCVQVCPTGALIDRKSAYMGKEKNLETTDTICIGCSVGCGIKVFTRDNQLVRIEGNWDAPVNGGVLCKTGRFKPLAEERERVTTPLVRHNGELKPATWEEALAVVTDHLKPLVGKKEDGVAALISTRLPAECMAVFKNLFAERFHSEMVTSIEEGAPTALTGALAGELGRPFEGKLEDIKHSDCVLAIGVDLVESHEVLGFFVKRSLPKNIGLVVVDPNENDLDLLANFSLKAKRGTDLDVIEGLEAAVIKLGLSKDDVSKIDVEGVLAALPEKTGLTVEEVMTAARIIGSAQYPAVIFGKGITARNSSAALYALVDLAQRIGAYDEQHASLISVKGEANSLAAVQYYLEKPFKLNGHQAAYVVLGDDFISERLVQRLEKAPFLAVQASYVSKLTTLADVVLPVETWAEQEGHYVNLEGRLQEAYRSLIAPEGVRGNYEVLNVLAESLQFSLRRNWKGELLNRVPSVAITEN